MIYATAPQDQEFRQGEVISDVLQYDFDEGGEPIEIKHPFVVVASQDCDLLREFQQQSSINSILLYEAFTIEEMRPRLNLGREFWKVAKQNNNERYHVFQSSLAKCDRLGLGTPDLIVDFRRFFALSPRELGRQCILSARRRCLLDSPYREHFQSRAAFYLSRVGLPIPHEIP